jgi:hypothetical protein
MGGQATLFREEQRFGQLWIWALVGLMLIGTLVLFGQGAYQQLVLGEPWGDNPMSDRGLLITAIATAAITIGVFVLLLGAKLIVEVREDGLFVRFRPFHLRPRQIPLAQVVGHRALKYRPIREYGGWGLRYGSGGRAYNVSGDRGVRIDFADGKHLLLGSRRPDELAAAIGALREAVGR